MLNGRAMYVFQLDAVLHLEGSVGAIVAKAVRAKISSIWVKIADGTSPSANILGSLGNHFRELIAQAKAAGVEIYGWHVPHCNTDAATDNEVSLLVNIVDQFGIAGVVVDNEDGLGFFKGDATTADRYGAGLHGAMQNRGKIVAMSSNDIVSFHPKSFATVIGKHIDVNTPQVYYGANSSVAVRLNKAIAENKVIPAPFFPVGVCVVEPRGEDEGAFSDPVKCAAFTADFIRIASALHLAAPNHTTGYGFWTWDQAPPSFWQVLFDTEVFVSEGEMTARVQAAPPDVFASSFVLEAASPTLEASSAVAAGRWTLEVHRLRQEFREGEGFQRTVGAYRVLRNGAPQPGLAGSTVERQGPSDNSASGVKFHRRLLAGTYPLGPQATEKYCTTGYATNGDHPRPALAVGDTGARTGILVHPADGYGSTIGCINLSRPLNDARSDLYLSDSVTRVQAVIEDLRNFCGGALRLTESGAIAGATLVIFDTADAIAGTQTHANFAALESFAFAPAVAGASPEPAADEDCFIYEQATGRMSLREQGALDLIGVAYSGSLSGGGRNDPTKQNVADIGPLPRGLYTIGAPIRGPSPYSLPLKPDPRNQMFGRSAFLIHGDSLSHPGNASEGCIILARAQRETMVTTGVKLLFVVQGGTT